LLVVTPYNEFFHSVTAQFPGARELDYNYDFFGSNKQVRDRLLELAPGASRILLHLVTPGGYDYLRELEPWKDKVTVVCSLSPVPLRKFPWVKTAIAIFGTDSDAFDAGVGVLDGQVDPTAKLPLDFQGLPVGGSP
ncbi:MAG: hypothetical protein HKM06_02200, partial [Spirochaetales bacterium]|nr:hypothetical protein [Spirochaetales bacterium]